MKKLGLLGFAMGAILLSFLPSASAEHVFEIQEAHAQYLDTIKTSSDFVEITIDEETFEIHYGYEGSMEASIEELTTRIDPKLVSMDLDVETKSLNVVLEPAPKSATFWVLLPIDFLSAEGEKYQLSIDGKETPYDLIKFPTAYAMGMIVPAGATEVQIVGTHVVPEFGVMVMVILAASVLGTVIFARKSGSIFPNY